MMTPEEIHGELDVKFGAETVQFHAAEQGDPFIQVALESVVGVCGYLQETPALDFDFLRLVTGVDWEDRFSVVYHLYSYAHRHGVVLRVDLAHEDPRIPSMAGLWASADWHERETFDMMGITFEEHPNPRRILLPDDWEGFPLRKDYEAPKEYHGISNE
jgi:NADH-quinone oxidoreductase subunit C